MCVLTIIPFSQLSLYKLNNFYQAVKLTTHLHQVPKSKNEWSYNPTPPIRLHSVVLS